MTYLSNHFVFYGISEPSIPLFSKELIWGGETLLHKANFQEELYLYMNCTHMRNKKLAKYPNYCCYRRIFSIRWAKNAGNSDLTLFQGQKGSLSPILFCSKLYCLGWLAKISISINLVSMFVDDIIKSSLEKISRLPH